MQNAQFQKDVLEASKDRPILVDFWASWCGPCKMLGPILDELDSSDDRWELVKVDVDKSQAVSREYGIRSIPQVMLFSEGKKIAEFSGAQSRSFIQKWLDQHLPSPGSEEFETLQTTLQDLSREEALEKLSKFLEKYPDHTKARLMHARYRALEDPAAVADELKDIERNEKGYEVYEDAFHLNELLSHAADRSSPAGQKIEKAQEAFRKKEYSNALDALIQSLIADRKYADELARKSCIAIFRLLGEQHTITQKHRKRFDMALY